MVVLKRIHIKNFRSIVDATIELDDFNFFVGKNDSGKSNVLKAINLFFNERTDYDTPFKFCGGLFEICKEVDSPSEGDYDSARCSNASDI